MKLTNEEQEVIEMLIENEINSDTDFIDDVDDVKDEKEKEFWKSEIVLLTELKDKFVNCEVELIITELKKKEEIKQLEEKK